jgi:hypothetical protein
MRDYFIARVKQIIAQRAGHRCSNPTCGARTSGPQEDPTKAINLGVAAHIAAASPGGPRHQPTASQSDRKSPENGIWLCQTCGKLIDNDEARFTEALLRHWKKIAEDRATQELGRQSPFDRAGTPNFDFAPVDLGRFGAPVSDPFSPAAIRQLTSLLPEEAGGADQIELLDSGRGAMGQRYGIIGAGTNYGWDWSVGLFSGGEFGWERIAHILLEGQKAWVPEAVYVPGTPGALVLTHVHGYGTGVFRRSTSWYRIAKGEPSPFFSYPCEFYVIGWGMPFGRKLISKALVTPSELTQGALLQLQFDIAYTMEDDAPSDRSERELFAFTKTLSLEWNEAAGVFIPRTASDDFAGIEEIWSEGAEGFAKRNEGRLKHAAQYGTPRQRSFIQRLFPLNIGDDGQI